ncbi:hypothetical protein ACNJYD_09505 [Bradyrhizobium sp. DASA03005]|uniref:hypothetical protein n=1 Tax=Bradyrhizobium sp. SPXBL-02 TaxID=3395912 RepID=UPI003F6EF348
MLSATFDGLDEPASEVAFGSISPCNGPCTVIGRNATAGAADAAFVNAVTSHATGQADCGGGGHLTYFVVSVSLAVGQQLRCSATLTSCKRFRSRPHAESAVRSVAKLSAT